MFCFKNFKKIYIGLNAKVIHEKIISWNDFEKIDMRVGTVIKAVEFKKAINPPT